MASQTFDNGASTGGTLTLDFAASAVNSVIGLIGAATAIAATTATIVTVAPTTTTNAQFTGTAQAPSAAVVLGTGWAAHSLVTVDYTPAGVTATNL